jgi:SAM-dependent methyltransferase
MERDSRDIKTFLSRFLAQKYLTDRLLRFVEEQGIAGIFESMHSFCPEDAIAALERERGYCLRDGVRNRMARVLMDFLCECGRLERGNGNYSWTGGNGPGIALSNEECGMAKEFFRGQVDFFERCIVHADSYLRGGSPLYTFDSGTTHIWEEFLGNAEFNFARFILAKMMLAGKDEKSHVLDLCYGPGFDILQIQECLDSVKVTALDFKDVFRERALSRIPNPAVVEWIDAEYWNGFGAPLPFPAETFDGAFFACADPYVPEELREFVYRDIFRVLKHGGSVNILSHSYPDPEKEYVYEPWVRRGTLCHDFSESVCEGWHGFYGAGESRGLFESIGFSVGAVIMNSSVWRLDKP